jgi:hypothetical protein
LLLTDIEQARRTVAHLEHLAVAAINPPAQLRRRGTDAGEPQ